MDTEKEELQLKNRLRELAQKSFSQNIFTFTGFLGLREQDIFGRMEQELRYAGITLWGGTDEADRKMARFGSAEEFGYEAAFPIACIHIMPLASKFSDDLSHRDFLGALMNLGIERATIGDIRVGVREGYLFCQETMADFICKNLEQVKHTHVKCELVKDMADIPQEEPERVVVQVASLRADAVIAKIYNKSREKCLELFWTGRVFIDGRLCENNSRLLKAGETVNARGYGKFRLVGEPHVTRKGKLSVEAAVFR